MDPSTEHDASSQISTGSVDPSLSTGLPLPIELCLMVYAHLTKIGYRKLTIHHKNAVFIYWPYISMPSAPACSSRELHSDLQAYLAEFAVSQMNQTSSFEGRPLMYSWICSHLSPWSRGSTAWVAKSAKICSYPGCFDTTRKGERPVEGPKNLHQPHGTAT
jgi:hypothetical protein